MKHESKKPESMKPDSMKHKNDLYGDDITQTADEDHPPAIPAATIVLLREHQGNSEVLMLHKTAEIDFGGLWVFPGGKIDDKDYAGGDDDHVAARNAAVRETVEEAGITIPGDDFIYFSHWTPPPKPGRRYATWFFISSTEDDHDISIDGDEIQNHQWINPGDALLRHQTGEIGLAAPTWVTLYQLSRFDTISETLTQLDQREPRVYQTHMGKNAEGLRTTMWTGDAGYDDWDATISGDTHRLIMSPDGFEFHHSAVEY
ncbi:MAG: NUDIX hydrolase [Gammaproteobacteria bacterium]|jgi:8-oxo-dGTP pyrophosphatase MutT (NUDIX family)|nr:NUDIX hydrolase [Gammaproteobacteria bacterium]MBT4493034.1 NUDIX hydrolase [Gammaproteobacteria bacterium]MBT7370598.1 NUDIX hydrolase [Gammaproteobacteria bacterium]